MLEWDGFDPAAAGKHLRRTDDPLDRPVAAFDQNVGTTGFDQRGGRIFVEPGDRIDAFQRRGVVDLALEPGGVHIPDLWLSGLAGCDGGGLHSSSVLLQ